MSVGALETVEKWLFQNHRMYCTHEKRWWQSKADDGPCACDEPRAALRSLRTQLDDAIEERDAAWRNAETVACCHTLSVQHRREEKKA